MASTWTHWRAAVADLDAGRSMGRLAGVVPPSTLPTMVPA
jgi:hypothetical protein